MNSGRGKRRTPIQGKAVEEAWNAVMESVDSRVLRRAKVAIKQGEMVGDVTVEDGWISAAIRRRGPDRRYSKVSIPVIDSWEPYQKSVATWFCQRPDWLASLLAGQWDPEFVDFVEDAGLTLCPKPEAVPAWITQAKCSCDDFETPCRHVVAIIVMMAASATESPWTAFAYVGLSVESLLDEVHRMTAERVKQDEAVFGTYREATVSEADGKASLWVEEMSVLSSYSVAQNATSGAQADGKSAQSKALASMVPTFDDGRVAELVARFLRLT